MKKANPKINDELGPEYKRSDLGSLIRGKYTARIAAATNVVVLESEVAKVFPTTRRSMTQSKG